MTIQNAKKLQWGTVLKTSSFYGQQFRNRRRVEGIYVGMTRDKQNIKVVKRGTSTAEAYAPVFWNVVAQVK